jgi:uncharacterized 2Fe-2S/4Fe-4S cluster protein (DUF4445 family)
MVFVPEESQARKQVVRKAATERAIVVDPAVKLYYVEIESPTLEHQLGDWDRLAVELEARFDLAGLRIDPILLHTPGDRPGGRLEGYGTVWQDREVIRCSRATRRRSTVRAVDIGTTTIVMHLCDLRTGAVLATPAG